MWGLPSSELYWPEGGCPSGGICDESPLPPRELMGQGKALQGRLLTLAQHCLIDSRKRE